MTTATEILRNATMQHHCAAKLDGMVIALNDAGAGNSLVTVTDKGAIIRVLPLMPDAMAQRAYWEIVSSLNAISIAA